MSLKVQIVEMGLRDGLQNEKTTVSVETRVELARRLADAGVKRIELGAFVRAEKIPQMAGSKEVIQGAMKLQAEKKIAKDVTFSALVPNERGMQDALQTGVKEIAIFASCTESFSKANINCTIDESFERFKPVMELAKKNKIKVRGYLSVCFGCPYEGKVSEKKVVELAVRLHKMGCFEISIGDTIGVADPKQVESLFKKLKSKIPVKKLAGHFHDTRGPAIANILRAYQVGVKLSSWRESVRLKLGWTGWMPLCSGQRWECGDRRRRLYVRAHECEDRSETRCIYRNGPLDGFSNAQRAFVKSSKGRVA
jgi:hydroxymethylglutaryl-CoA lyase